MYRSDHPPGHFHAQYGEHFAQVQIASGRILEGSLPPRALRLTREWAKLHRLDLEDNWRRAQGDDPLVPIAPLP